MIVWDTELRGFGCKITPKGRRSYLLYYRTADGQQRKPALGVHGAITTEQARDDRSGNARRRRHRRRSQGR